MSALLAFLALSLLLSVTPGPDSVLVLRSSIRGGRRLGVATALGSAAGSIGWGLAAAFGVASLLEQSATAYQVIKYAGAAYLVILGLHTLIAHWRHGPSMLDGTPSTSGPTSRHRAFAAGLTSNLLNPKMGLFYLAVLPQFIPSDVPFLPFALLLCLIELVVATGWLVGLAYLTHSALRLLRRPAAGRWLERMLGVSLIGLGASVAIEA